MANPTTVNLVFKLPDNRDFEYNEISTKMNINVIKNEVCLSLRKDNNNFILSYNNKNLDVNEEKKDLKTFIPCQILKNASSIKTNIKPIQFKLLEKEKNETRKSKIAKMDSTMSKLVLKNTDKSVNNKTNFTSNKNIDNYSNLHENNNISNANVSLKSIRKKINDNNNENKNTKNKNSKKNITGNNNTNNNNITVSNVSSINELIDEIHKKFIVTREFEQNTYIANHFEDGIVFTLNENSKANDLYNYLIYLTKNKRKQFTSMKVNYNNIKSVMDILNEQETKHIKPEQSKLHKVKLQSQSTNYTTHDNNTFLTNPNSTKNKDKKLKGANDLLSSIKGSSRGKNNNLANSKIENIGKQIISYNNSQKKMSTNKISNFNHYNNSSLKHIKKNYSHHSSIDSANFDSVPKEKINGKKVKNTVLLMGIRNKNLNLNSSNKDQSISISQLKYSKKEHIDKNSFLKKSPALNNKSFNIFINDYDSSISRNNILNFYSLPPGVKKSSSLIKELQLSKQQNVLNKISPTISNISCPYMDDDERKRLEVFHNKEKWLDKKGFYLATQRNDNFVEHLPKVITASPSKPPILHKFRDTKKDKWVDKKGFKVC